MNAEKKKKSSAVLKKNSFSSILQEIRKPYTNCTVISCCYGLTRLNRCASSIYQCSNEFYFSGESALYSPYSRDWLGITGAYACNVHFHHQRAFSAHVCVCVFLAREKVFLDFFIFLLKKGGLFYLLLFFGVYLTSCCFLFAPVSRRLSADTVVLPANAIGKPLSFNFSSRSF